MNTKNNRRRRASREKIERVFVELLQIRELNQISVSELCKGSGLNRSTFYANYQDIYELADRVRERLEEEVRELYREEVEGHFNSNDFLKLFRHIQKNQLFYKTYFKLGYDSDSRLTIYDTHLAAAHFENRFIDYHQEFFKAGFNAIVKRWLADGCRQSPEEMDEIVRSEYRGRQWAAQRDAGEQEK